MFINGNLILFWYKLYRDIYSFLNIGIYVNVEVIYLLFFIYIKLILKVIIFCIEKIDILNNFL